MPAQPKISAQFIGDPVTAFLEGCPARSLTEAQFDVLSDEQKVKIAENAASPHAVYVLKRDAPEQAAEAEKRLADAAPPPEVGVPAAAPDAPKGGKA